MVDRDGWRMPIALLGLATIGSYGLVLYGFGAFVAPIRDDTGWSNGAVAAAFSISTLGGGLLALVTGRLIDRLGGRWVMGTTLTAGSALLAWSSFADDVWLFVAAWGIGGSIIAAGLFYNATMAIAGRITTDLDRPSAFTWLTVIGGLASPIAFPLAGAFVEAWGWRPAVRAMVVFMVMCALPAVVAVRGGQAPDHGQHGGDDALGSDPTDGELVTGHPADTRPPGSDGPRADGGYRTIGDALRSGTVRRWLLAGSCALTGLTAVQVHHVAAIEATGVAIGVASTLAGVRGLLSLPGRAAAASVSRRIGTVGALRLAYLAMSVGTLALLVAGAIGWVWVFVVLTGLAFGSVSPLQGLFATELYGQRRLGTLMGMQQVLFGAAGAAGPFLLGLTVDATGGYATMLLVATALQVVALISFRSPRGPVSGRG